MCLPKKFSIYMKLFLFATTPQHREPGESRQNANKRCAWSNGPLFILIWWISLKFTRIFTEFHLEFTPNVQFSGFRWVFVWNEKCGFNLETFFSKSLTYNPTRKLNYLKCGEKLEMLNGFFEFSTFLWVFEFVLLFET